MGLPSVTTVGGLLLDVGYEGQIAKGDAKTGSAINENATAIQAGRAIARGAGAAAGVTKACKPVSSDSDLILGIAVKNAITPASADGNNTVEYKQRAEVPFLESGYIFCKASEAARAGDQALALVAGGGTIGASQGGVAGSGRLDIPGASWDTTTALNAIGVVFVGSSRTRRLTT